MTTFYDQKDLEEDLSRVGCPDEDLDFEYLFEYEPPCSDVAGGGEGLSDAFLPLCGDFLSFRLLYHRSNHVSQKLHLIMD